MTKAVEVLLAFAGDHHEAAAEAMLKAVEGGDFFAFFAGGTGGVLRVFPVGVNCLSVDMEELPFGVDGRTRMFRDGERKGDK